ncbi:hypothetical protein [Pedobacter sp. SYP-B3415]|uniref:hypothetical protein n=1 Tax=Pedobacter sp. SYP-B3415 TaxID=2496641 RepID=UPI00101D3F9D|nr:hypothetical protein [Pedobacter sp. SYP-B3415]
MKKQNGAEQSPAGDAHENESKRSWNDPLNGPEDAAGYSSRTPEEGRTPSDDETEREPESGDKLEGPEDDSGPNQQGFDVDESTGGSAL